MLTGSRERIHWGRPASSPFRFSSESSYISVQQRIGACRIRIRIQPSAQYTGLFRQYTDRINRTDTGTVEFGQLVAIATKGGRNAKFHAHNFSFILMGNSNFDMGTPWIWNPRRDWFYVCLTSVINASQQYLVFQGVTANQSRSRHSETDSQSTTE